jgi:hypothetical protein
MRERVVQKHFSQSPEQNDRQEFRPLFGGGKIKICDTLRAVTPFGGLSVFIEFLGRIGLVEQLASRTPYRPKSGNHYDPGQILVGFILSVIAGAQRFAHTNELRADRALHALLGMKRFPSDDTILNYFRRFSQAEVERFWRPCGGGSSAGFRNWKRVIVWIWIRRFFLGMAPSNKEPPEVTILADRAD